MQTIILKSAKLLGGLFIFFAAFTACKKDPVQNPVPQPVPQPAPQELVVQFSTTGISMTGIDSVILIVRDQNYYVKKWKKMNKAYTSFRLSLQDLAAGMYTAEILAYSKKRADFTARQFALSKEIVLPLEQATVVNAPNGTFQDPWFQRAVFFEGQDDAVIIVAMDPRDSYYELRFKEAKWKRLHMQRFSVDVNVLVASKSNSRSVEGLIGLGEYADFSPYVEKMHGKNWTIGNINGYIEGQNGQDIAFEYEYNNN